jgi:CheY-like chemotaxis protein/phosphoribosyl 1,2-cyclic phosphodiesterase
MEFFIVDDDPDIVALLVKTLEDAGHMVQQSTSSREALTRIPQLRPECVITDIMIPEMDGFELTRELRRRGELAHMKIIVLSMKSYEFDRRRARQLGADGYIVKPIKRETVLAAIQDILSEHVVVSYWGVHGTLPVPGPKTNRYGGNTPCVTLEAGGEPVFVFDCGSGIKKLSDHLMGQKAQGISARIFISHPHWDHINTIPFFAPLYVRGNQIEIHGPYQGDLTIERVVSAQMESVYFPVTTREFGARVVFRDLREESLTFGPVRIDTRLLSHPGYCLGYRITSHGKRVCYITDNEIYLHGDPRRDEKYLERLTQFVGGADLLITDTTYRDHE